jgi:hypothetical protein
MLLIRQSNSPLLERCALKLNSLEPILKLALKLTYTTLSLLPMALLELLDMLVLASATPLKLSLVLLELVLTATSRKLSLASASVLASLGPLNCV